MRLVWLAVQIGVLAVAGCTTHGPATPDSLAVAVTFDQQRSRFSGKGAGAGMMLSSTMGAAGVAIGIAIDEGIGKDIQTTADNGGIEIRSLFIAALEKQAHLLGRTIELTTPGEADLSIRVKRYGFVLQPGSDDPVAAQFALVAQFSPADAGDALELSYPVEFKSPGIEPLPTRPLERLKANAADIEFLWRSALHSVFADSRFITLLER